MALLFGKSTGFLCDVFNTTLDMIYSKTKTLLYFNKQLLTNRMDEYCRAVHDAGSPLQCVYGFIDGTKMQTCRIKSTEATREFNLQKHIYSGHKRVHCLNYQAVTTPDGLALHFYGPIEGARHDITLLRESRLFEYFAGTTKFELFELF